MHQAVQKSSDQKSSLDGSVYLVLNHFASLPMICNYNNSVIFSGAWHLGKFLFERKRQAEDHNHASAFHQLLRNEPKMGILTCVQSIWIFSFLLRRSRPPKAQIYHLVDLIYVQHNAFKFANSRSGLELRHMKVLISSCSRFSLKEEISKSTLILFETYQKHSNAIPYR